MKSGGQFVLAPSPAPNSYGTRLPSPPMIYAHGYRSANQANSAFHPYGSLNE